MSEVNINCHNCSTAERVSQLAATLHTGAIAYERELDGVGFAVELGSLRLNEIAANIRAEIAQSLIAAGIEPTDDTIEKLEAKLTARLPLDETATILNETATISADTRAEVIDWLKAQAARLTVCLRQCSGTVPYGEPNALGIRPLLCQFPEDVLEAEP